MRRRNDDPCYHRDAEGQEVPERHHRGQERRHHHRLAPFRPPGRDLSRDLHGRVLRDGVRGARGRSRLVRRAGPGQQDLRQQRDPWLPGRHPRATSLSPGISGSCSTGKEPEAG